MDSFYAISVGAYKIMNRVEDEETRNRLANEGAKIIEKMVQRMNLTHAVEQMRKLEEYNKEVEEKCPWVPSNFNKNRF